MIKVNMKKSVQLLITGIMISVLTGGNIAGSFPGKDSVSEHKKLALVTYACDNVQVKQVKVLVESLRMYGGIYSSSSVYVVKADTLIDFAGLSELGGVFLLHLRPDAL